MIKKITITFLALFAIFSNTFAQSLSLSDFTETGSGLSSELIFEMYPSQPSSNEEVLVKLNSYYFDLNASEVVVYLNGKEYEKQIGLNQFKFITANPGERNLLQVLVRDPKGKIHTKKIDFTSENVGLVYEVVNSNVPFGYKGKSIATSNSELNVYAFPDFVAKNGKKIDKKSLIYTWYKNGEVDLKSSGFGKYKYHIKRLVAFPDDLFLDVVVTDVSKNKVAKNSIKFNPNFTEVDFYYLDTSLPFTFKNVSKNKSIEVDKKNVTILAVPYFMNMEDNEPLEYTWKINGKKYIPDNPQVQDRLVLFNDAKQNSVVLDIFFQLKNDYRIFQTAYTKLKLILKSNQDDSIINQQYFNEGSNSEQDSSGLSDFFGF